MSDKQRLEMTIYGETLRLRVEPDEAPRLKKAAALLEERLEQFSRSGGAGPNLRVGVLAALDIAHELIRERDGVGPEAARRQEESQALTSKIQTLNEMIDGALD